MVNEKSKIEIIGVCSIFFIFILLNDLNLNNGKMKDEFGNEKMLFCLCRNVNLLNVGSVEIPLEMHNEFFKITGSDEPIDYKFQPCVVNFTNNEEVDLPSE